MHNLIYTIEVTAVTLLLPIYYLAGTVYLVRPAIRGGFLLDAAR